MKVKLWISAKTDSGADCTLCSVVNFPNRDRATTNGHRSEAQNGQNSAPTKSTSGFPFEVRGGCPANTVGAASGVVGALTPIVSKADAGTVESAESTPLDVVGGRATPWGVEVLVRP